MQTEYLHQKIQQEGFISIDDFIKANLHHLSKNKQRLFYSAVNLIKTKNNDKKIKKCASNGKG